MTSSPPQRRSPLPPTPRQKQVLDLINQWLKEKGYPPTYQEIADEFGQSKVSAFELVLHLRKKGLIQHSTGAARGILPTTLPSTELARLVLAKYSTDGAAVALAKEILAA